MVLGQQVGRGLFCQILQYCTALHDAAIAVKQDRNFLIGVMSGKLGSVLLTLGEIDMSNGQIAQINACFPQLLDHDADFPAVGRCCGPEFHLRLTVHLPRLPGRDAARSFEGLSSQMVQSSIEIAIPDRIFLCQILSQL